MSTNGQAPQRDPLELFIKLLGMTTSTNDSEAFLAMRKANDYLKTKLNSDWDSFVRGKIKIEADPFLGAPMPTFRTPPVQAGGGGYAAAPPPPPKVFDNADEINGYFFKMSTRSYHSVTQDNINRIERLWEKNGQLIWKDYDFIKKTALSRTAHKRT